MIDSRKPLSPHLQVYKWQLTSVLSILHRMTGVFLGLGSLLLCYWLLAAAAGPGAYALLVAMLRPWYGQALLLLILLSLYYHLCNGIRHLFWDAGIGLELHTTYRSGYAVVIATLLLTAGTCFIAAST
jgi:succinate dehydrogenase / fumarate reductase cytochrome b subunit